MRCALTVILITMATTKNGVQKAVATIIVLSIVMPIALNLTWSHIVIQSNNTCVFTMVKVSLLSDINYSNGSYSYLPSPMWVVGRGYPFLPQLLFKLIYYKILQSSCKLR